MKKRPIDIKRESAASFKIEAQDDDTYIEDMLSLNHRILMFTQKGIYEVTMADRIDPKRENIDLPHNVQKCILKLGTSSEIVGRTILTAKELLKKEFLAKYVVIEKILETTMDILTDLDSMHNEMSRYKESETKEIEDYNSRPKGSSLVIPCVKDIKTYCKNFFQKADHVEQALWEIIKIFLPDFNPKGGFEKLIDFSKARYGENDVFTKHLEAILPFWQGLRNIRDCLEHRGSLKEGRLEINNFVMNSNGTIDCPSLAISFRKTEIPKAPVYLLMQEMMIGLVEVYENLLAFLCSKNIEAFAGIGVELCILPEERRRNKFVKFFYNIDQSTIFRDQKNTSSEPCKN